MQNETKIGIALAIISVILVAYFAFNYPGSINVVKTNLPVTGATTGTPGSPAPNTTQTPPPASTKNASSVPGAIILTPEEIAKHNSDSSCWMIVGGKVYDVTSYVYQHPGGAYNILKYCGADGTVAFETKGGRGFDVRGRVVDEKHLVRFPVYPL